VNTDKLSIKIGFDKIKRLATIVIVGAHSRALPWRRGGGMMRELTMDEVDFVSGGVSAGVQIAIGAGAVVVGAVGLAVFGPELVAAVAAGSAWEAVAYGGGVGISALDGAAGASILNKFY
jgi:hypothetical protein